MFQRSALESCVKGWGVSVLVGWTDMHDFAARPIQLIAGRTWKGSLFGGNARPVSDPNLENVLVTHWLYISLQCPPSMHMVMY